MSMDIGLIFSDDFPAPVAGQCFLLRTEKGVYTLGRNDERAHQYDIDVNNRHLSRQQAALTFHYNAFARSWQVSDAGLNDQGECIPYKNRCQVNGEFIPRNTDNMPDPVSIDPHDKRRIVIGGDPEMKILVVAECESTLDGEVDPFSDGLWGTEVWKKVHTEKEPPVEESEKKTAGLDLASIQSPYLKDFVALSRSTGQGLSDPTTRVATILSILSGLCIVLGLLVSYWVALQLGLFPQQTPQNPPERIEP